MPLPVLICAARKGSIPSPADLSESNPRVSLLNFSPKIEHAHHHELSLSRRIGKNNLQVAAYADRVDDPALTGPATSRPPADSCCPTFLRAPSAMLAKTSIPMAFGWFCSINFRVISRRPWIMPTVACSIWRSPMCLCSEAQRSITTQRRHAVAAKLSGTTPRTHTRWIASYRWVNGPR